MKTAQDTEFLELAARSGCIGLFIGLESIDDTSLAEINKKQKLAEYEEIIKTIHSYKINILGSFIFGFDNDNKTVFERTLDFSRKNKLTAIQINVLMPFPGTDLYRKLKKANRLLSNEWWMAGPSGYYDMPFEPERLSKEDIKKGSIWVAKQFYSLGSIAARAFSQCNKSVAGLQVYSILNFGYRNLLSSYPLDKGFHPCKIQ